MGAIGLVIKCILNGTKNYINYSFLWPPGDGCNYVRHPILEGAIE